MTTRRMRVLLEKMTPRPWRHSEGRAAAYGNAVEVVRRKEVPRMVFGGAEDADRDGIVAIVNAAGALLDRVEALEAGLREALPFVNHDNGCSWLDSTFGRGDQGTCDCVVARLRFLLPPEAPRAGEADHE